MQNWIHTNFIHCNNVSFTKDLITLGSKKNTNTDRIFDLLLFMGQYIFTAKLQGNTPQVKTLITKIKHKLLTERYYYIVNNLYNTFTTILFIFVIKCDANILFPNVCIYSCVRVCCIKFQHACLL